MAEPYRPKTWLQKIRWHGAELIGRERANRLIGPVYDHLARRRAARYLAALDQRGLLVNLGCGYRPMDGWVNVDAARGPRVQVVWDLRQGLPFQAGAASAIFAEHVIEHLEKDDARRLLAECYRVLAPNGVLRLSTPDAEKFLRSYAGDRTFLRHPDFAGAIDSPVDRINEMMRENGQHRWAYDEELLSLLLRKAGFRRVQAAEFGCSAHPAMTGIDFEARAFESLYIEAIKELE